LKENHFDIILIDAVLRYLRDGGCCEIQFTKLHKFLNFGGCLLIRDVGYLIEYMLKKYVNYLGMQNTAGKRLIILQERIRLDQ
jgi:hypothetical protein